MSKSSMMSRKDRELRTRFLAEGAIMLAVATVLSWIKIDLPLGGGITLVSMLPIIIISHRWGWKKGLLVAFLHSAVQLLFGLDNVGYATSFGMALGVIFLDYIVPYTALGFSALAEKHFGKTDRAVFIGILVTLLFRFACHYITGVWIWAVWAEPTYLGIATPTPWVYSALYNGWYMLFEIIITECVAMILYQALGKYFRREDLR
ncbi:MAG: energy-coupled thiamine transporter ThiT [Clostridia bacterium]|nr:energy-coupled thiamine transporter ThiT [Clostridia bacterium]